MNNPNFNQGIQISGNGKINSENIAVGTNANIIKSVSNTNMAGDRNINTGGGNYNERIEGDDVQGNYYAGGEPKTLADAAAEIQALLEQLDKTYPIYTTTGKMAIATEALARIEGDKSMSERVLSALKAGGVSAFEQLLNHPAASFVIGALDDWQQSKGA